MEKLKICVTGGSGYIGSWLVKKLLEKGHTVHATIRDLGDSSKVSFLKSLPGADSRLVLFQANVYNPEEFESAITGCQFVFHLATPMLQNTPESKMVKNVECKEMIKATVAGVRSIADSCISSKTVKRLIYTASITASSPLQDGGKGFRSFMDESCWTPLNISYSYDNDLMDYVRSKTLAEKEALSYNNNQDGRLEVVSLVCGMVAGETLLGHLPLSMDVIISQLTGNPLTFKALQFLQEFLGCIPLVHIDDVCEAHIFCMEKPSLRGRFICASTDPTLSEIANYFQEFHTGHDIPERFMKGAKRGSQCDNTMLIREGFEYKYDLKKILDDSVECGKRFGVL